MPQKIFAYKRRLYSEIGKLFFWTATFNQWQKLLLFFVFFVSCKVQHQIPHLNLSTSILFQGRYVCNNRICSTNYIITVPEKGKLKKMKSGTLDYNWTSEYRMIYPDSSIIYMGDNTLSGSRLNYKNRYESNHKTMYTGISTDSFYLGGRQNDGKYWKEVVLGNVYIGYCDVDSEKVTVYDQSLKTLRIDTDR